MPPRPRARGETYTFTDAWGRPRTWVKGEYAYLAPNAAGLLLARCNLKHHLVEEAGLDEARLERCSRAARAQRGPSRAGRPWPASSGGWPGPIAG